MKLFIQIKNGQPYEHPVMEENMRQLFPKHDLETVPEGYAMFTRVKKPMLAYESIDTSYGYDGCTYESDGKDGFRDVWNIRIFTKEEKAEKIALTKQNSPHPSWIFNEETCTMIPPVGYEEDL